MLALVALAALALAGRPASAAGVSVEAGNDYFCSHAFEGSVCETDITAGDTVTCNVVSARVGRASIDVAPSAARPDVASRRVIIMDMCVWSSPRATLG